MRWEAIAQTPDAAYLTQHSKKKIWLQTELPRWEITSSAVNRLVTCVTGYKAFAWYKYTDGGPARLSVDYKHSAADAKSYCSGPTK